ncbi:uncharacterized protein [Dermacentor andersoni]|uniref:uncharacterized protein isoform X1 n=1 Tax=Dermacentor andersoni TaxID=34620 RepID=UPI003B3A7250
MAASTQEDKIAEKPAPLAVHVGGALVPVGAAPVVPAHVPPARDYYDDPDDADEGPVKQHKQVVQRVQVFDDWMAHVPAIASTAQALFSSMDLLELTFKLHSGKGKAMSSSTRAYICSALGTIDTTVKAIQQPCLPKGSSLHICK